MCGAVGAFLVFLMNAVICAVVWARGWRQQPGKDRKDGEGSGENIPQIGQSAGEREAVPVLDANLPRLLGRSMGRNGCGAHAVDVEKGNGPHTINSSWLSVKPYAGKASSDVTVIEEVGPFAPEVNRCCFGASKGVLPSFATDGVQVSNDLSGPWISEESDAKNIPRASGDTTGSEGSSQVETHDSAESASTCSISTTSLP